MTRYLPLSLVAALTCAGIATASVDQDAGFNATPPELWAFSPILSLEPRSVGLAVHDVMEMASAEGLDQPFCDAHVAMSIGLARDFGETRQTLPSVEAQAIELWASEAFGTWTLIEVDGDRIACVTASGFGWTATSEAADLLQLAAQL